MMRNTNIQLVLIISFLIFLTKCVSTQERLSLFKLEVPFVSQGTDTDCAATSLAILLRFYGIEFDPRIELNRMKDRRGILPVEVEVWLQSHNVAYQRIKGGEKSLLSQIKKGKPVMVLWNRSAGRLRNYHYVVVTGYNSLPGKGIRFWLVHDGQRAHRDVNSHRFHDWWSRADYWGLVLVPPNYGGT